MTIERKVGMGIAGQPSGDAANVAEVFSTDLWDGTYYNQNGAATTINNGIDLAGEGGLVWLKTRVVTGIGALYDTGRGANSVLFSAINNPAQSGSSDVLGSFTSTGFVTGANGTTNGAETASENSGNKFVSWTFRKKEKFFDIVTFTGNSSTQTIAHGLGGPVGMIIIKTTSHTDDWNIWHRSIPTNHLRLDTAAKRSDITGGTAPTDTHFTLNNDNGYNGSGRTYVAYVFADNSSEDADDQMIKCGSYNTSGSGTGSVNLGWEPQFIMMKRSDGGSGAFMYDTMRGLEVAGRKSTRLYANDNSVEYAGTANINITATGFNDAGNVANNANVVYMAIRAPMMKEPEAATEVFAIDNRGGVPAFDSGFPVDFFIQYEGETGARLTGRPRMRTHSTEAEITEYWNLKQFHSNVGMGVNPAVSTWLYSWMWKRAKGFMDVVAYSGTGSARTQAHSLGVVPEMIWVKSRSAAESWNVLVPSIISSNTGRLTLNENGAAEGNVQHYWGNGTNYVAPTDSNFTVSTGNAMNGSGKTYIAVLFATLAGISKVGSYTGNGSNQTINCGFSAGAKYALIKRTDAAGDWHVWDSVRGIVAGNEPYFRLNIGSGEITNNDSVDPHNSGFIVNQLSATNINVSSGTYIFYAIA